jgi:hypothetical protein
VIHDKCQYLSGPSVNLSELRVLRWRCDNRRITDFGFQRNEKQTDEKPRVPEGG